MASVDLSSHTEPPPLCLPIWGHPGSLPPGAQVRALKCPYLTPHFRSVVRISLHHLQTTCKTGSSPHPSAASRLAPRSLLWTLASASVLCLLPAPGPTLTFCSHPGTRAAFKASLPCGASAQSPPESRLSQSKSPGAAAPPQLVEQDRPVLPQCLPLRLHLSHSHCPFCLCLFCHGPFLATTWHPIAFPAWFLL